MKKIAITLLLFAAIISTLQAQNPSPGANNVLPNHTFEDLYKFRNFYISEQPEVARLTYMKDQGITTIINLRTEEENETFKEEEYDEKFVAEKLGFKYFEIPVDYGTGFNPENLAAMIQIMDAETPTLIHCSSGRRATYLFIAYLVREQGISLREAVDIGRQMKYTSPLEELLGKEIIMEIAAE